MYYLRKIAFFLIAWLSGCLLTARAQSPSWEEFETKKAAAVEELKKYPRPDTARINALIQVCSTSVYLKEREAIAPYRAEALALSRKLNYVKGLAQMYASYGHLYKSSLNPIESLKYFDSALHIIANSTEP